MFLLSVLFFVGCMQVDLPDNPLARDDDGDGYSEFEGDCDDRNPEATFLDGDRDCDGVKTVDDCDDGDSNSTIVFTDGDCDGIVTVEDCDDGDSSLLSVFNDMDCDRVVTVEDCDDSDPNTVNDMDCDGVVTVEDCDDGDPNSTIVSIDGDCDGVVTVNDCDDDDPNSTIVSIDGDCDGVVTVEDCDDGDSLVTSGTTGASASCAAASCKTILDDGYSTGDGNYWIDPDGNGAFEAYCDMTTDGGGWTLIEAYDIINKAYYYNKTFNADDMSRNALSPNWDDYRLSLGTISSLTSISSKVHARCHREYSSSPNDYIFGDIELITNDHYATQLNVGNGNPYNVTSKIRGYDATTFNMRWYQGTCCGGHWHAGSDVGSLPALLPNSTQSEDSFTWHNGVLNTNHLCHTSAGEIVWMVR